MRSLIAAALLAMLALTACQSTAGGTSGGSTGGGSTSGGSSTSGGGGVASAAQGDGADTGSHTTTFDGCTVYFGMSSRSSSTYFVSASRDGIGGQAGWSCAKVSAVARLQITATIEHALTLAGPYSGDPEPSATANFDGDKPTGALFPHNSTCTTDWWRVKVHVEWDEAGGGHLARPDLYSQPRKVTDEDCHRS
jgi:hypothetical protein